MFNKPGDCITAKRDISHKTVMDYFPDELKSVLHPLGRLDKDTEGLLVFADDGQLDMQIMQPHNHVPKKYHFWAIGTVDEDKIKKIETGVMLTGQTTLTKSSKFEFLSAGKMSDVVNLIPLRYRDKMKKNPHIPVFEAYLTITEGKKHQVKRMVKAIECCVVCLKRVSIGSLMLDENLKPGEYRKMTDEEIELLYE